MPEFCAEVRAAVAAAIDAVIEQERDVLDALATAHFCPSVESGNPEDCAFGNEGCRG